MLSNYDVSITMYQTYIIMGLVLTIDKSVLIDVNDCIELYGFW